MNKILVVDDDTDLLEVVSIYLRLKNFEVNAISRWEEMSAAIEEFKPDLIIMDISLSGADGRVLCKQLKTNESTRNIPVMLFSAGYKIDTTLAEYMPDAFIPKPFENGQLINTINSLLAA